MEDTQVTFKKRGVKSANARKKAFESGDAHEEFDAETLQDIKLQQTSRARKSGSSLESLTRSAMAKTIGDGDHYESKTIESVMGTQYTTQMDYGIDSANPSNPHKKLMDQYIENKLGLSKPVKQDVKPVTEEDNLYKIPDHIKAIAKVTANKSVAEESTESNGIMSAWSTGLAEVALPISFKLKNIEATEKAAQRREHGGKAYNVAAAGSTVHSASIAQSANVGSSSGGLSSGDIDGSVGISVPIGTSSVVTGANHASSGGNRMPFQRFMVPDRTSRAGTHALADGTFPRAAAAAAAAVSAAAPAAAAIGVAGVVPNKYQQQQPPPAQPGQGSAGGRGGGGGLKRSQQSSDDYMMQQYKQRQMNHRR